MTQSVLEKSVALPAIESEGHFFQISGEMFRGDFMPCSSDTALQERKGVFDGVCVDFAINVDPAAVIDSLVPIPMESSFHHRFGVAYPIIRDNYVHILADVLADVFGKGRGLSVLDMEQPQLPIALPDADYDLLVRKMRTSSSALLLAADIGLVYLDHAIKGSLLRFQHSGADAMAEVPRGLIAADFEDSLHLQSRDAFLRFAEKECGDKPLGQGQVGVVKNRASHDGELRLAIDAAENGVAVDHTGDFFLPAFRADWAGRPAELLQILPALAIAVESLRKLRKSKTRKNGHGHSPMAKRKVKKRKSDRQVLKEIFPPEIVREVDATLDELNSETPRLPNPSTSKARPIKPWGRKWVEKRKSE